MKQIVPLILFLVIPLTGNPYIVFDSPMQKWWGSIKHFSPEEKGIYSPDVKWSGCCMDWNFMRKLEYVRKIDGQVWVPNSGFRTEEHNKAVGGASNSPHLYGRAIDISTRGWTKERVKRVVKELLKHGMTGIGVADTFIHVDDMTHADGFVRPRIWFYKNGKAQPGMALKDCKWLS